MYENDVDYEPWQYDWATHLGSQVTRLKINQNDPFARGLREEQTKINVRVPITESETNEQLDKRLDEWEDQIKTDKDQNEWRSYKRCRDIFGDRSDDHILGEKYLDQDLSGIILDIGALRLAMAERGMYNVDSTDMKIKERVRRLHIVEEAYCLAYHVHACIGMFRALTHANGKMHVPESSVALPFGNLSETNGFKWNEFQKLSQFYLQKAAALRLKKKGPTVYRPRFICDGKINTQTYERDCDMIDWVHQAVQPQAANPQQYYWYSHKPSMPQNIADFLTNSCAPEFPKKIEDRRVFSCKSGLFNANVDVDKGHLPYGHPDLDPNLIACTYTDAHMDAKFFEQCMGTGANFDWLKIPTPAIDSVLDSQGFSNDVKTWFYVLCGRMLWDVSGPHSLDGWQAQMFFKGIAGTGKSTILRLIASLYDASDVGILSNTIERTFPLEALLEVYIYLGMDVSKDFSLDQTLWQSMVSGEQIAINRKFKARMSVIWKSPGALAGNQLPPWSDNAGSISRRMLIFPFHKIVKDANPNLDKDIEKEKLAFIYKITAAARDLVKLFGRVDVWKVLPKEFRENKQMLQRESNALEAFISTPANIQAGDDFYIPMDTLKKEFMLFCRSNTFDPPKWVPDYYLSIFQSRNFTVVPDQFIEYPFGSGEFVKDTIVKGLDLTIHRTLPPVPPPQPAASVPQAAAAAQQPVAMMVS